MFTISQIALDKSIKEANDRIKKEVQANEKAMNRAISHTVRGASTYFVKRASQLTKVKQSLIRGKKRQSYSWQRISVRVPSRTGGSGQIKYRDRPFYLDHLLTSSQLQSGLKRNAKGRAKTVKLKGRTMHNTFIGRGISGGKPLAFHRSSNVGRLPIERRTLSLSKELNQAKLETSQWARKEYFRRALRELSKERGKL